MKGIIFTEFLEMVENEFGFMVADEIIQKADLPSGGAYTAISTYDHSEIVELVVQLSKKTGKSIPELLTAYGKYQFPRFVKAYPVFFKDVDNVFQFLGGLESYIHPEVTKLYPDAELPSFDTTKQTDSEMEMVYHSERKMADFAKGLIQGAIKHFGENINVEMIPESEDGSVVRFKIIKH